MLSYHVHSGSGPYFLLAHGALSNSAQWTLNIPALQRFCTPVTVELLGHGDSPSPENLECYTPDAYVDYFETIRQALGTERWFVCGYSLGAALTVRYALTHPERLHGHLLTNSNSAFADDVQSTKWHESGQRALTLAAQKGSAYLSKLPFHPRFATAWPKDVYSPLVERAELLDPLGVSRTLAVTVPRASVRDQIGANVRPALLLHGVREKAFSAHADYAKSTMPKLEVCELNAGHGVNMQAADAFNVQVEEFVAAWAT